MSPKSTAGRRAGAAADGVSRLIALEDKVLHRVLSFLPSREAVQTSLLASRFRDEWKSVPALRLTDAKRYGSANKVNQFVNSMLLFRRRAAPVRVLEICTDHRNSAEASRYLELWVRYCLSHEAKIARVHNKDGFRWMVPTGLITSSHLMVLDLMHVILKGDRSQLLDFSCCPALEDVTMESCDVITATTIMFPSVKRLRMNSCDLSPVDKISAPNLLFLQFADCDGSTPSFEPMPMLVSAYVRLMTKVDCCDKNHETGCNTCEQCHESRTEDDKSTLLEALSNATNLELISAQDEFTFRKDLIQGPEFNNLRNLLLNEWCITSKLGPLHYFLQHSPVLEKLTLQLSQFHVDLVDNGATYGLKEPATLKHLAFDMIHDKSDKEFPRVLDLLNSYGIPPENINIQHPPNFIQPWPSASFSFEQQYGSEDNDIKESEDVDSEEDEDVNIEEDEDVDIEEDEDVDSEEEDEDEE